MQVCLMIEGQEGVAWDQWVALARACEDHGLDGLFRSDHYVSISDPGRHGALEAWSTIAALGAMTSRIRLGVLVSPVTFRHPSILARAVVTADHTSGGRVEVGMGAGWYECEHREYGFPFPDVATRMEMLAEQLEVVHGQWRNETFDFDGRHYRLEGLRPHPAPVQRPHPPIILGGRAGPRSASLAARFADEYNTVFAAVDECRERRRRVERAWEEADRDPSTVRFSVMTGIALGDGPRSSDRAWLTGSADQVTERLRELADAGVDRVMLQHLAHDDLETVATLGDEVVPNLR